MTEEEKKAALAAQNQRDEDMAAYDEKHAETVDIHAVLSDLEKRISALEAERSATK